MGRELNIQIHDVIEDTIISMQKKKKNSKTDYNKIVKNQSKLRIIKSSQGKINNDRTYNEHPMRLFVPFLAETE